MATRENDIYMDHAATTPVRTEVLEAMLPFFTERAGNPSSIYRGGREAYKALERARDEVAAVLHADRKDIIFTSGGSEGDNLAIKGVAWQARLQGTGNHIITSVVEHHAVLHACQYLEKFGFEVTYLPVDHYGRVSVDEVERAIRPDTALISIMYANNEVGTIQPIHQISELARARKIPFHTDAVQAAGALSLDVDALGIDLLSLSAHKFYGPKGAGIMFVRRGTPILYQQQGGSQERNRRAGTENIPGIVGTARALTLAYQTLASDVAQVQRLRDRLVDGILQGCRFVRYNGHPSERLPNNANFCFEYVEGEGLLLSLDLKRIAASSGSACNSASLEPSHVLRAMGIPVEIAHGSLRLTLGRENTDEEVDRVLTAVPEVVEQLRRFSPNARARVEGTAGAASRSPSP